MRARPVRKDAAEPFTGGRSLAVLLLSILALAGLRAGAMLADMDFWWTYPRANAWLLVLLYWGALAASLAAAGAGLVLVIRASGCWRVAGLAGAAGGGWVLITLVSAPMPALLDEYWNVAAGNVRPANVVYEREARLIRLSGGLERGSAAQFKEILNAAADVRIVDVSGPGGLIYEARWISRMVEERGLDTMVSTECHSACVDIFASGKRRLMYPKAVVGLHSARTFTGGVAEDANSRFTERLYKIGVEPRFLMVGSDTPPDDIWINTARQAYLAGLATEVVGQ